METGVHRGGMIFFLILFLQVTYIGSEEAKIRIVTAAQKFSQPVNTNLTLPCTVINLDDSVVTWTKDGQVISADSFKVLQDSRIRVAHKSGSGVDLQLTGLRMEDTGLYKCTVNVHKQSIHIVHKVVVEVPPYIESLNPSNGSITVKKGSRVRLECKAGGQPKPNVFWNRQHNQPLHWKHGITTVKGEILDLANISREMGGEYVCNADNGVSAGPVWQTIDINVLYPPEVSAERSWIHAGEGEEVTLACTVYSNPQARVYWYKRTMKLLEGERIHMKTVGNTYRLSLSRLEEGDYGDYYCKAGNILEEDVEQHFILTGKPSGPEVVGDPEGGERYSYDLAWQLTSSYTIINHEIVYWQADQVASGSIPPKTSHIRRVIAEQTTAGGFKYNMKGLQNNTFYDVMVRSQNKHGWSPYSPVQTFRTAQLDKEPLEVRVPSETIRPLYQGQKIDPAPVTSRGAAAHELEVKMILKLMVILQLLR